ncbi:alpha/beta fold hydrolase [Sphingomonas aerolata]|uniref:alpha/beta fold hydrolase n=1 Tax=Sphingomonas aerolata TaxID=185951 RepID=UPI001ABB8E1C|nr:alpha/beta fold hydrolase [Sphingomonas aerolata]NII58634.1 pimeloyl-ACP methyl ester carboxylesterase [Sphingomonas aerolata]
MAKPFTIAVPDERLAGITAKVASFDWGALPDAGSWTSGVGLADLKRLVDHWRMRFDWRAQERRLNALPQFTTEVLGEKLHFIHARGDGSRPPLLLLHGWPGSFLEFEALIAPLVADGHDVVVPSLPGYAFSGRPAAPIGPRRTGVLMHGLMTELFGDARYLVQGGDWGAAIGSWMAHDHPEAVAALHLNMVLLQAADISPKTPDELAWAARRATLAKEETGYAHEQGTRPQTLGIAMSDSPVGVAAWILEKFGAWSDVPRDEHGRPDLWQAFDEDTLLTNIMLYLVEGSFITSTWMYRGRMLEGSGELPAGSRIKVPTGVAAFPDPVFPPPPRSQARKTYNIVHWSEMEAGGHFAALEQPGLLLADMRRFFADQASAKARRRRRIAGAAGVVGVAALGFWTLADSHRRPDDTQARHRATYPPLDVPKVFAEGVWIVDSGPINAMGIALPVRMTIIRLENGDLLLHSPTLYSAELAKAIEALGRVRHLVAPNIAHWTYIADWQRAYPDATTWAAPGLRDRAQVRASSVRFDAELGGTAPAEWSDTLDQGMVPAGAGFNEIWFFHRQTRTLVLVDLIENLDPDKLPPVTRLLMQASAATDGTTARYLRLAVRLGGADARKAVRAIVALEPDRVIFAHGRPFDTNGAARLKRAFEWLI